MSRSMQNDGDLLLDDIDNPKGRLCQHIQQAQRYMKSAAKARKWADHLRLLKKAEDPQLDYDFELVKKPSTTPYLAVSYCWSAQNPSAKLLPLRIQCGNRGGGGSVVRESRARPEVILRSHRYAAFFGLEYFWIDQECIEQEDRDDKEDGIQSMDLVYQRATRCVALLGIHAHTTESIVILRSMSAYSFSEDESIRKKILHDMHALDIVKEATLLVRNIAKDKWFTRAWTLQEFMATSQDMDIMVRWSDEVTEDMGRNRLPGRVDSDWDCPNLPGETIMSGECFLDQLRNLCYDSGFLEKPKDWKSVIESFNANRELSELRLEIRELWRHLPTKRLRDKMSPRRSVDYRFRMNALLASTVLAGRRNSRTADRLAILANLCDYKWRIDTRAVDAQSLSYSACALALFLYNGDISFTMWGQHVPKYARWYHRMGCWLPPMNASFHEVNSPFQAVKDLGDPFRSAKVLVYRQSISIEGCLWWVVQGPALEGLQEAMRALLSDYPTAHITRERPKIMKSCLELVIKYMFSHGFPALGAALLSGDLEPASDTLAREMKALQEWSARKCEFPDIRANGSFWLWLYRRIEKGLPLFYGKRLFGDATPTSIWNVEGEGLVLTPYANLQVRTLDHKLSNTKKSWAVVCRRLGTRERQRRLSIMLRAGCAERRSIDEQRYVSTYTLQTTGLLSGIWGPIEYDDIPVEGWDAAERTVYNIE